MPQTQGYLIVEKKSGTDGKPHPVDRTLKLGRGQTCDVRVHVQSVSDEHCVIIVEPGKPVCVCNLSKTSPTLLNGVSIGTKKCELQHGDYVSLGERRFRWEYLDTSPFYRLELKNIRRKSDADAIVSRSSQPMAVVLPMMHVRRTLEPSIISQVKRDATKASRVSVPADTGKAPRSSPSPEKALNDGKMVAHDEEGNSPKRVDSLSGSSVFKTPRNVGTTGGRKSVRNSVTPQSKQPASARKSMTPQAKQPSSPRESAIPQTKRPTSARKSATPQTKQPTSARKSVTPETKQPTSARKSVTPRKSASASKKTPKSSSAKKVVAGKGLKRKISVTPTAAKRLKIESPKSLDKRKVAALWGIHGKSPAAIRMVTPAKSSSTVKSRAGSTAKSTAKKIAPPRSTQKSRRPLFSEILKKAVARANAPPKTPGKSKLAVATKKTFFSGVAKKKIAAQVAKAAKKQETLSALTKVQPMLHAVSTGHANSPETFYVGRKLAQSRVSQGVSRSPAEWVKSARQSAAVTFSPKQASPKRKGPLRSLQEQPSTSSPSKTVVKSPKVATPNKSPVKVTPRASLTKSATPKSTKRTSLANPLAAQTPLRASSRLQGSPAITKATTPKVATPKVATPKAVTPKAATPKAATPKAATPKAATPKAATPKAATPKAATPKAATPKAATPKAVTPKAATPKAVTPKSTKRTSLSNPLAAKTPLRASSRLQGSPAITKAVTPKVATPKVATPKVASPKVASPKVASPKVASPKVATPKVATPKVATPKVATPKVATPKAATPKPTKRTSLANPLAAKTPLRASSRLQGSPAITKAATPNVATPKVATPKVATPKVATPKSTKRTSLANPLAAKTPLRASSRLQGSPAITKAATPKVAIPKAATPKNATPKVHTPKLMEEFPKPSPRVLSRVADEGNKRVSLPIPLRVKTPRLTKRASLPKSSKLATSKSRKGGSFGGSPKPITPESPKPESPAKNPKPATPKLPEQVSLARSPQSVTPKVQFRMSTSRSSMLNSIIYKRPAKSPKPTTPISPRRASLVKSPTPTPSPTKSLKRMALVSSPSPIQTKLSKGESLTSTLEPTTLESPEVQATVTTPQPSTSFAHQRKSVGASPKPATPKSPSPVTLTPKLDTLKTATPVLTSHAASVKTPLRTFSPGSTNLVLEAMKRATMMGSPKRISLPSTSGYPADARRTPIEVVSPLKRTNDSSSSVLSPEMSLRSPSDNVLVQTVRDRMAKFSPDRSKRLSSASTVLLKSPEKSASSETPAHLVTSTPAPGHRSSILLRGSTGGFTDSPPQSANSNDSSNRSKNLSVTFSENLVTPGQTPSSSKVASQSMTPENEVTSFDFSAVKTPNVPREMFVSSILSSSSKNSSSSVKASGSAKRKSKVTGSRESLTSALCSDRRSVRSPMSPGGYIDVKGIKRLTAAPIKSPTYLAVEGVKRLFGEAKAVASDSYTSISGVRELFASPSPSRNRSPEKVVARDSVASSPVAKIQAQVEERNWNAPRVDVPSPKPSPKPAPAQETKATKASKSSESPVQASRTTRSARNPRNRVASPPKEKPKGKKVGPKSSPKAEPETSTKVAKDSPAKMSPKENKPAQAKHRRVVSFDLPEGHASPIVQRATRNHPNAQEEPNQTSPPSKRVRPAASSSKRDTESSPETKRGRNATKEAETSESSSSPVRKRVRAARAKAEVKTSPPAKRTKKIQNVKTSPVKEPEESNSPVGRRGRTTRANVAKPSRKNVKEVETSLVKPASPVARSSRKNSKEDKTSPVKQVEKVPPVAKRVRLPRKNVVEEKPASPVAVTRGRRARDADVETVASPPKKSRTEDVEEVAPKRGGRKNAVAAKEESSSPAPKRATRGKNVETSSPVAKRQTKKAVEEEEESSPVAKRTTRAKGGKSGKGKVASPTKKAPSPAASPAKRTTRGKDKPSKDQSPQPSPRKTRQRK